MSEPTINDLHVLLVEQKGDTKLILSQVQDLAKWREQHEKDDKIEHAALHKRVNDMKIYSTTASIISVIVGIFTGTKIK